MNHLPCVDKLVSCLCQLPGVGRRSAERMALSLAREPRELSRELAAALNDVVEHVACCSRCGALTGVGENPCRLCTDPHRDEGLLCVVENPEDIRLIERSQSFKGRYHSLMGKISPMSGQGYDDVRIAALLARVKGEGFREVVLALNTDVESDATAAFLGGLLKSKGVKVTRLAFGLPVGSGIGYSDPVTLARAMKGRQAV